MAFLRVKSQHRKDRNSVPTLLMKTLIAIIALVLALTSNKVTASTPTEVTEKVTMMEVVAYRAAQGIKANPEKDWKWFLKTAKEALGENLDKNQKKTMKGAIGKIFESLGRGNQADAKKFFNGADIHDVRTELFDLEEALEKK